MQDTLAKLPAELQEVFSRLVRDHERVVRENQMLRQQLRLLRLEKYGARSEKLSDGQLALLEGEPSVVAAEVQQEAQQPAAVQPPAVQAKPTRRHPGRVELPAHLERREVIIACAEPDCICSHCQQIKPIIGYERSEALDVIPAHYFVKVTLREKRACPEHPEGGVSRGPAPAGILPKSKLSDALIVDVLVKKYGDYLPAYRQSAMLARDARVELSRKTLIDVILKCGGLLQGLMPALKADLFAGRYIQADETPVPCQVPEVTGRNHQAYLWEFSRPAGPVIFEFKMSRAREGPKEFLRGYTGVLQSDGYAAYDKLGEGIEYAACLAHVRREFHRAHLLQKLDARPLEILDGIGQLYGVEAQARASGLDAAQRLALRQQRSRGIFDQLRQRILELRAQPDVLPASQLGKACTYALGLWKRLEVFLSHGQVEIDSNWCENAIRPLAVGRKNWLHIGSEQAGPLVAALVSIFETCRRYAINPRDYLLDVLPRIADWPVSRVAELTPMAWCRTGQVS
jgi:transposase